MSFSDGPGGGAEPPLLKCRPPGPSSRTFLTRASRVAAPMGPGAARPRAKSGASDGVSGIVYATARGSNVTDVDGNRYVDLAAGFGAVLLGHGHPAVHRVLALQSERLLQALGDVHPSDAKVALLERLSALHPEPGARVVLGQSGADAITCALKTAVLVTGRPGVLAFRGAYHGLSYAPLAACGLRESYRAPFEAQLNPRVTFAEFPADEAAGERVLEEARTVLRAGTVGAVLVEPVLGRGGVVVPPVGFLRELSAVARELGALVVLDEIWTGLGRSGAMLAGVEAGASPDLVCLGKGLGGGLPMSACIGSDGLMASWRRDPEVVHTSTFAGAPLACATAIATLDVVSRERLVPRSAELGVRLVESLRDATRSIPGVAEVRGKGLMVGIDLGERPGSASRAQRRFLERGYVVSTGGTDRDVVVLTPPLTISEAQLEGFVACAAEALDAP